MAKIVIPKNKVVIQAPRRKYEGSVCLPTTKPEIDHTKVKSPSKSKK